MLKSSPIIEAFLVANDSHFQKDEAFDMLLSAFDYSVDMTDEEPDEPIDYVNDVFALVDDAQGSPISVVDYQGHALYAIGGESAVLSKLTAIINGTYVYPEGWLEAREAGRDPADGDDDLRNAVIP